jgi:hypothetical protein
MFLCHPVLEQFHNQIGFPIVAEINSPKSPSVFRAAA